MFPLGNNNSRNAFKKKKIALTICIKYYLGFNIFFMATDVTYDKQNKSLASAYVFSGTIAILNLFWLLQALNFFFFNSSSSTLITIGIISNIIIINKVRAMKSHFRLSLALSSVSSLERKIDFDTTINKTNL